MKKKNDGVIEITASIGVALTEGQETDFETLYKSADFALYKAKKQGRNRYVLTSVTENSIGGNRMTGK